MFELNGRKPADTFKGMQIKYKKKKSRLFTCMESMVGVQQSVGCWLDSRSVRLCCVLVQVTSSALPGSAAVATLHQFATTSVWMCAGITECLALYKYKPFTDLLIFLNDYTNWNVALSTILLLFPRRLHNTIEM